MLKHISHFFSASHHKCPRCHKKTKIAVCLTWVYSSASEQKLMSVTSCFYYWIWCRTF